MSSVENRKSMNVTRYTTDHLIRAMACAANAAQRADWAYAHEWMDRAQHILHRLSPVEEIDYADITQRLRQKGGI